MAYPKSIWGKVATGLTILGLSVGVHADELSGVWKGPWYLGMSSGVAVLRLEGGSGSLQMTNNENFGAEPVTLKDVSYESAVLRFRAKGSDGSAMTAGLPVRDDGAIRGAVTYGGYKLLLELSRVTSESR
jgi:hypothetical protein